MNRAQRIVCVIALAALALTIDHAVVSWSMPGGWYGYAPGASTALVAIGIQPGRLLLVRLALLAAWTLASLRLLGDSDGT